MGAFSNGRIDTSTEIRVRPIVRIDESNSEEPMDSEVA
jgi:hypothetical protein